MTSFFRGPWVGWTKGLLWVALVVMLADVAQAKPLMVEGVEVALTQPLSSDPRQEAMATGKVEAFNRLLWRMIPGRERDSRRASLAALGKASAPLIERVMIRSEKRGGENFSLTLDVAFSEEGVRRLLEKQGGIAFNVTPYPSVLLLMGDEKSGEVVMSGGQPVFLEVAKSSALFGFALAKPLGDMDDMINISWSALRNRDPKIWSWLTSRYPASVIWVVTQTTDRKGQRQLLLNEILEGGGSKEYRQTVAGDDPTMAKAAQGLVGQVMDGWIQSHLVYPSLRHEVVMRLIHTPELPRQAAMMTALSKLPGLVNLRFVQIRAWETVVKFDYEGKDDIFIAGLTGLGWQVDRVEGQLVARIP